LIIGNAHNFIYEKQNQDQCTKKIILIYLLLVVTILFCAVFNFVGTLFDVGKVVKVVKTTSNIEFAKPLNLKGNNGSIIFCIISVDTNT